MKLKVKFYQTGKKIYGKTIVGKKSKFKDYIIGAKNHYDSYFYEFDKRIQIEHYNYINSGYLPIYFHLNLTHINSNTARNIISLIGMFDGVDRAGSPTFLTYKQYEINLSGDIHQIFDDISNLEKLHNI